MNQRTGSLPLLRQKCLQMLAFAIQDGYNMGKGV
jgi:hypothetical protein